MSTELRDSVEKVKKRIHEQNININIQISKEARKKLYSGKVQQLTQMSLKGLKTSSEHLEQPVNLKINRQKLLSLRNRRQKVKKKKNKKNIKLPQWIETLVSPWFKLITEITCGREGSSWFSPFQKASAHPSRESMAGRVCSWWWECRMGDLFLPDRLQLPKILRLQIPIHSAIIWWPKM